MDSTGSTLFIYHLSQLQSCLLASPGQRPVLGVHLSFFRAGQCSSATSSSVAARPLPNTSRQMRCFKPDEMGDLVLFSPNGAALRRTNTSVLHPPFWSRHTVLCLPPWATGGHRSFCLHACTYLHMSVLSYQGVFLKFGNVFFFSSPSSSHYWVTPHTCTVPQWVNLHVWHTAVYPKIRAVATLGLEIVSLYGFFRPEKLSHPLYWLSCATQICSLLFFSLVSRYSCSKRELGHWLQ